MDEIRFGGGWHLLGSQSAATVRRLMAAAKSGEAVSLTPELGMIDHRDVLDAGVR